MSNKYDKMDIDIDALFENNHSVSDKKFPGYLGRMVNRYWSALLIKLGLYSRMVDAGIICGWFVEFKDYWINVLGGRPLYLHDFFYLLGVYRQRFQDVETPQVASVADFLDSWQNKDTVYMLFGAVRKYAYEPLNALIYEKWISHGDSVMEYGCGIAPVTYSLLKYGLKRNLRISVGDIRQINSHYAKMRLQGKVKFIEIEPYKESLADKKFDVVLMITVLEHLPDPLAVIQNIVRHLEAKGILIFDYILGDGDGQDTLEAVQQRGAVVDFLKENFDVYHGKLLKDQSMGTTVCQLR